MAQRYDSRNRLIQTQAPHGKSEYSITLQSTTIYHYNQMGMLVTETTATGTLIKDYIWQDGMMPIARIDTTTTGSRTIESIIYLYTDHLMTNRLATNHTQAIVWRWEGEAFGNTPAQELAGIPVNLRFPGQYYDQETNLHYNWNRYYDPSIGRYITSDPIGLDGGMNTYLYALANPLVFTDPNGLRIPRPGQSNRGNMNGPFGPVCGSGWPATFIPANGYFSADFTPACAAHDSCYETCGRSKASCDSEFRRKLRQFCGDPWNFTGILVAEIYYSAVAYSGTAQEAYNNAQKNAGCCGN